MDDRQQTLRVAATALDHRMVPVAAAEPGIADEIVADEVASRPHPGAHEAAQLVGAGGRQDRQPRPTGGKIPRRMMRVR